MTWTKRIDDVVSEQHLLKHPFYTAWTEGRLSQSALRGYAAQFKRAVAVAGEGQREDRYIVDGARLDQRLRSAGWNQVE